MFFIEKRSMLRIKRLYTFVLGTFLPLMLATYSVCLFIILMQFVWQFVNDMVGKGVGMNVLAEMFFYAALSFTPMALPLAILLASLMTFGNLGEHLELLAMKASGISLLRIMKPLIFFVVLIAGVSFLFQNDIAPRANTKMYAILGSLRRSSPELDIPEGSFY
jgi:lipopolysaccharide export system permease protein